MDTLEGDPLALTIVAVAAFAGLSRTEIRGLRWGEYNGQGLQVVRGVWESHVGDPKTEARRDTVPVILPLGERLEQWYKHCDKPREEWMFASESNTPVHLGNLINRNILPVLDACMICGKLPGATTAKAKGRRSTSTGAPMTFRNGAVSMRSAVAWRRI